MSAQGTQTFDQLLFAVALHHKKSRCHKTQRPFPFFFDLFRYPFERLILEPFEDDMHAVAVCGHGAGTCSAGTVFSISHPVLGEGRHMECIGLPYGVAGFRKVRQRRDDLLIQAKAGFNQGCQTGGSPCMSDIRFYGSDGTRCFWVGKIFIKGFGFNPVFHGIAAAMGIQITDGSG